MAAVRFSWSPLLVSVRREVCPRAQWQSARRQWMTSEAEAQRFIDAAQTQLEFQRRHAEITIDGVAWLVGFVRGAPYRIQVGPVLQASEPVA